MDGYRIREKTESEIRALMENVLVWAGEIGQSLNDPSPERSNKLLRLVVEQVVIDRDAHVLITLVIPIESSVDFSSQSSRHVYRLFHSGESLEPQRLLTVHSRP